MSRPFHFRIDFPPPGAIPEREVLDLAAQLNADQVSWEHGQWWISRHRDGATWSVHETAAGLQAERI